MNEIYHISVLVLSLYTKGRILDLVYVLVFRPEWDLKKEKDQSPSVKEKAWYLNQLGKGLLLKELVGLR